jgi:hypothetical protein
MNTSRFQTVLVLLLILAPPARATPVEESLSAAHELRRAGKVEEALEELQAVALPLAGSSREKAGVTLEIARCRSINGDEKGAVEALDQAFQLGAVSRRSAEPGLARRRCPHTRSPACSGASSAPRANRELRGRHRCAGDCPD